MERWKSVPGYKEHYEVSDLGRVRRKSPGRGAIAGRLLFGSLVQGGYLQVEFSHGTRQTRKCFLIHRLVAHLFLGTIPLSGFDPARTVNHKDGDKQNNRVENLEVITQSENLQHAITTLNRHFARGAKCGRARLTEAKVKEIRRLHKAGHSGASLAKKYDVTRQAIRAVCLRLSWAHVD